MPGTLSGVVRLEQPGAKSASRQNGRAMRGIGSGRKGMDRGTHSPNNLLSKERPRARLGLARVFVHCWHGGPRASRKQQEKARDSRDSLFGNEPCGGDPTTTTS